MKKIKTSLALILALVVVAERGLHSADEDKPAKAKSSKAHKKTVPKKSSMNAADLLGDMEKSTVFILKSATAAKLDPKEKKQIPFFSGLKAVAENVDLMKKSSAAKDPAFFKQMDAAGKAVVQINSAARMLRVKDKHTLGGIKALGISYNELLSNYGKNAARKKKGGDITAKETEQLAKLRGDVKKLYAELAKLKAKVKAKNDPELLLRFDEVSKNATKVSSIKGEDLAALLAVTEIVDLFYFEWYALGETCEYWYPDVYTEWTTYNVSFEVYFDYYEESHSSWEVSDWSYLETSYDLVDSVETYDVEISETEMTSMETSLESYSEESATEESTEVDTTEEVSDAASYDMEEDADGDGLEDSMDSDDDGDGTADAEDTDDDGDGMNDDDADGDGTADAEDTDDDGDGMADAEDPDGVDDSDAADDDAEADDNSGGDEEMSGDDDSGDDSSDDSGGDDDGGDDGGGDE